MRSSIWLTLVAAPLLAYRFDLAVPSNVESIIYGGSVGEQTGMALATGDVNGDGIADMLVAAPMWSSERGRVYVIYGETPLQPTYNVPAQADVVIQGNETSDRLGYGWGVATGDVNGDGIDDILLGANAADGPGNAYPNAGEAYIIFGSTTLPALMTVPANANVVLYCNLTETSSCTPLFGTNVSSGDINGDGIDDILYSADGTDAPGRVESGVAYVLYGRSVWSGTLYIPANADVTVYAPDAYDAILYVSNTCYFTAHTTYVGDVDGDGFGDFVWGLRQGDGDGNAVNEAGELHVVYGSAALPATIDLASYGHTAIYGTGVSDRLARTALADLNGDGLMDVLGGAQGGDGPTNGRTDAGEVYIELGGALPSVLHMPADADLVVYGGDPADYFGYVEVYDYDGDGMREPALSSFAGDGPGNGRNSCGDIFTFEMPMLPGVVDLATDTAGKFWYYGAQVGDSLTVYNAMWAGDVDADAEEELMLGSSLADRTGTNSGVVYIVGDPRKLGASERGAAGGSRLAYVGGRLVLTLASPSPVELRVWDVSGRLALSVYEGTLGAGEHAFALGALPSGAYVAVLKAGSRTALPFVLTR